MNYRKIAVGGALLLFVFGSLFFATTVALGLDRAAAIWGLGVVLGLIILFAVSSIVDGAMGD